MAHCQVTVAAGLLCAFSFLACRSPVGEESWILAGADPSDKSLTLELRQLDRQIEKLEKWLSSYPGRFDSDAERRKVHSRWIAAVERSTVLMNIDLGNPELYLRAGSIFRQGHNLDVPEAASSAYRFLSRCIALDEDHVECRYELARLFLSSDTRFAGVAENLLLEARSLIEPVIRPAFEAALAQAYHRQGRRSSALRQIDRYLTLVLDDVEAQRFRATLIYDAKSDAQFDP